MCKIFGPKFWLCKFFLTNFKCDLGHLFAKLNSTLFLFSYQPCHSWEKLRDLNIFSIVFITTAILSTAFNVEKKITENCKKMQIFFKLDFFQENEPVSLLKEGRIFLGPRGPLVLPLVNQPARAKNLDTQIQAYICLMNHQETHQTNPVQSSTAQYSLVPPSRV